MKSTNAPRGSGPSALVWTSPISPSRWTPPPVSISASASGRPTSRNASRPKLKTPAGVSENVRNNMQQIHYTRKGVRIPVTLSRGARQPDPPQGDPLPGCQARPLQRPWTAQDRAALLRLWGETAGLPVLDRAARIAGELGRGEGAVRYMLSKLGLHQDGREGPAVERRKGRDDVLLSALARGPMTVPEMMALMHVGECVLHRRLRRLRACGKVQSYYSHKSEAGRAVFRYRLAGKG